ncbi:hypothetical protein SAMN04487981_1152 [Streptomyces sp. cf386]|uniref:hypothetical protein n=1 Tax=Streptomyces sp. cf386 TaxID=1761904 RepID=UPI00087E6754|nr:hypothetical protein [Streptomyces sp. cf386]SDO95347.1 hypothetical protein SAMN04487981_1152 [Streptomyces sp. cf386]
MTRTRRLQATAAAGGSTAALVTAAATTNTPWLYGLAVASASIPWLASLAWRCIFAAKPSAVRKDLLELARIEGEN